MKTIEAKTWRTLGMAIPFVAMALVALDFFEPEGRFGHSLHALAFPLLVSLGGCGALIAVLERAGLVRFHYTEDDKRRLHYRMARRVAEREHRQGYRFSDR